MSGAFNGYHVWLGIPPNEQPPNHYRLLGITPFETDLDVIEHAADRQMAHVRTFQSGRHGSLSQQILNELAAARLCLLSIEKKIVYDEQLREKLGAPIKSGAVPVGKAVPVAKVVPMATPMAKPQTARAAETTLADDITVDLDSFPSSSGGPAYQLPTRRRRSNQSAGGKNAALLGALMAAVLIGGLFLYYFLRELWRTTDWKQILGVPGAATASPNGGTAAPAPNTPAPPPPTPNS